MINTISIALSGIESASKTLRASASNIANLTTTGSLEEGGKAPYAPLTTTSQAGTDSEGNPQGVRTDIVARKNPFVPSFAPGSPFANEDGLIAVPNIDLAEEAVNSKLAEIQFKANIATLKTAQELSDEVLKIFDKDV